MQQTVTMATINKTISIETPVARVFAYLEQPENFLAIWPSMVEVTNTKVLPNAGHSFDWVYKMAGVRFSGHTDTVEYAKDKMFVAKNAGGIPSTFRWNFEGKDGHTEIKLDVEYTIPGSVLSKLAEPIVHRINEHEADTMLKNLKAVMEGHGMKG